MRPRNSSTYFLPYFRGGELIEMSDIQGGYYKVGRGNPARQRLCGENGVPVQLLVSGWRSALLPRSGPESMGWEKKSQTGARSFFLKEWNAARRRP